MNTLKKLKYTFIGALISLSVVNCTSDNEEELFPNTGGVTVSFATDVQPIIENSCAVTGCHVSGVQSPDFTDKDNILNSATRIRVRAVVLQTMPPSNKPDLSSSDIDILKNWIDQGALDN